MTFVKIIFGWFEERVQSPVFRMWIKTVSLDEFADIHCSSFTSSKQGKSTNRCKHTSSRASLIYNQKNKSYYLFPDFMDFYILWLSVWIFCLFLYLNIFVGSQVLEWSHFLTTTTYHNKRPFSEIWGLYDRHLFYESACHLTFHFNLVSSLPVK